MENGHCFELIHGQAFEKKFQVNGVDYLVKHITSDRSQDHPRYCNSYTSGEILAIEIKSDISVLINIKVYEIIDDYDTLDEDNSFTHFVLLRTDQRTYEINLDDYGYGPFICFVKVTRCENWYILDSAKKLDPAKNAKNSESMTTESRLDGLSLDMKRLFEEGEHSDVILIAGSNEFRAHKLILSTRSKVFSKMFQHPMKENVENRVTIIDVPSEVLKELLTFIYTGVVTMKDMKMARDLYVAADKYDVEELKAACSQNLKDVDLHSVLDTLVLADLYGDQNLKQSSFDYISANYSQVKRHKKWESFMKENQVLALEVLSFVLDQRA